jgi:hypothetical protein
MRYRYVLTWIISRYNKSWNIRRAQYLEGFFPSCLYATNSVYFNTHCDIYPYFINRTAIHYHRVIESWVMGNLYLKYRYSNFINVHAWCPVIKCIFIRTAYSTGNALRYETLPSTSKSTSQRTQSLLIVKTKHRENIPACQSSCKLSYICPNLNKTIMCKWILLKRKLLNFKKILSTSVLRFHEDR